MTPRHRAKVATLAAFVLAAGSLAGYIPLAAVAGVLAVVAWNMAEKRELWTLVTSSRGDAPVVLTTLFLTIFRDLTEAIIVGFALGAVVLVNRMAKATGIERDEGLVREDRADHDYRGGMTPFDEALASNPDIAAYRISGAFFFGAAATVGAALDRIADSHRAFIVDFSGVPVLDSTAANTMHAMLRKAEKRGVKVYLTGTNTVRRVLFVHGARPPHVKYLPRLEDAVESWTQSQKASAAGPQGGTGST